MGMPISSASSGAAAQQLRGAGAWQQRKQSFDALSQALQSGDLNAAKEAFSTLSSSSPPGTSKDPNSPLAKIAQALQTGDLSAAQSALSSIRGHRHHGGGGGGNGGQPPSISTSSPLATSGSIGRVINVTA